MASSATDHRGSVLLTVGPRINRCHRMGRTTRQSRQSQQGRIPGLIRTDKKTDMKMKTRRQRYDNEDPSAGHNSTPPPSKMMSPSSDHEDRKKKIHEEYPGTDYQQPNPLMTTQLSTSAGLGHFLAIELPNNKDQKPPKDEKMNCVDTIE